MGYAWRHWYHVTLTCYGQWLRGDPRGWRERDHRLHVEGDYKHPPKPSAYNDAIFKQSKRLLKHDPVEFVEALRPSVGVHLLESFGMQQVDARSIAVGAKHTHLLIQCPLDNPKVVAGKAKNNVWMRLKDGESPADRGGIRAPTWALGCGAKAIQDQEHFLRAFWYDLDHRDEGAWVWCYLEPRDGSVACRHTRASQ